MRTIRLYNKYDWTKTHDIVLGDAAAPQTIETALRSFPRSTDYELDAEDIARAVELIEGLGAGEEANIEFLLGYTVKALRTDGEPQPNEVWETRTGHLALITHAPHQFMEVEAVTPHSPPWLPQIFSRHKRFMLWYDGASGWTTAECMSRLAKRRDDVTPAQFFVLARQPNL